MRPDFEFDTPHLPYAWHHVARMPEWVSPILLGAAAVLYFLPALVAVRRHHHNRAAIALLNLFLGWTGVGWALALVWAATAVQRPLAPSPPP